MPKEQNYSSFERDSFDQDYDKSHKTPWFALIVGAQIALMLVFFALIGEIGA